MLSDLMSMFKPAGSAAFKTFSASTQVRVPLLLQGSQEWQTEKEMTSGTQAELVHAH